MVFAIPVFIHMHYIKTNSCTIKTSFENITCEFTIRRCDPKRAGLQRVSHKTITSDPLKRPQCNFLIKNAIFFSQIQKSHFSNIKKKMLAVTNIMSVTNIIT